MQDSKKSTEIRNGFELIYMLNNQIIVLIKFTKKKSNYFYFILENKLLHFLLPADPSWVLSLLCFSFLTSQNRNPKKRPMRKSPNQSWARIRFSDLFLRLESRCFSSSSWSAEFQSELFSRCSQVRTFKKFSSQMYKLQSHHVKC